MTAGRAAPEVLPGRRLQDYRSRSRAALSLLAGCLGGELVGRLGVGVADDAELNAPASYETGIRLSRPGS